MGKDEIPDWAKKQSDCRIGYRTLLEKKIYFLISQYISQVRQSNCREVTYVLFTVHVRRQPVLLKKDRTVLAFFKDVRAQNFLRTDFFKT